MSLENLLKAVVAHSVERKVIGRKRLQKLVHLLKVSGVAVDADFKIHRYGPFSPNVANKIEELAFFGGIEEKQEAVGIYGTRQYVYRLSDPTEVIIPPSDKIPEILNLLDAYSVVELEVASTMAYFEDEGSERGSAIEQVREMKPSKAIPPVIAKASKIIDELRAL